MRQCGRFFKNNWDTVQEIFKNNWETVQEIFKNNWDISRIYTVWTIKLSRVKDSVQKNADSERVQYNKRYVERQSQGVQYNKRYVEKQSERVLCIIRDM